MIKKTINIVLASILLTYSFNLDAFAGNTKYKAVVKKVKNKVEFKYEENSWTDVQLNQIVIPITSIRTGALSKVEIMFSDGTVTRIGSRTFFTLLDKQNRAVNVKVGRIWFNVKKKSHGLKIYSPDAVAAITGTEGFVEFFGNIDQENETYTVQPKDTVDKISKKLLGDKSTLSDRNKFIENIIALNPDKIKKNNFLYSGDKLVIKKVANLKVDKSDNYFALGLVEGTSDVFKSGDKGEPTGEAQKVKEGELLVLKGGNFSIQNIGVNALLEKYGDLPKGMIEVKGGSFKMGGDGETDEKPIHDVKLSSFYIGKYEVTQSEYKSIIGKNPSFFVGDNLPVENISWWDAIKYCNKKSLSENLPVAYNESNGQLLDSKGNVTTDITKVVGYRLPTEAEWEYASRGGNKSKGYKYSGSNSSEEVAWYGYEKIDKKTHTIGTKKSNEIGLFDMSGNVSEWVYDVYISDAYSKTNNNINPYFTSIKPTDYKVYRGGSWNYIEMHQSVFNRSGYIPEYKGENIGLRVARSIVED